MDQNPFPSSSAGEKTIQSVNHSRLQHAIIKASELSFIATDKDGIVIGFNKAAETLLGYSAAEVIGIRSLHDFCKPGELLTRSMKLSGENGVKIPAGMACITARLTPELPFERQEWTFLTKDGVEIPVVASITGLWENEAHLGYCAIATSVSDQLVFRQKMEETQAQLSALISSIDDIVFQVDEEGRFRDIWVKSDDFLFLPRERILGKTLSEMLGEEFAAPFDEGLRTVVLDKGESFNWEYQSPVPGDDRWYVAKAAMIFDRGVRTNRISVTIQEITRQKKMELSIRESEEKFRLLAENIPGVVYLMRNDDQKSMIYLNAEVENLTGLPASDFLEGKTDFLSLIHEDDRLYVDNVRQKSIEDGVSFQLEYRIRHSSGSWRWISDTGASVARTDGVVFLEGCITDITPRKHSEEELGRMADENSRIFNNTLTLAALATFDGYFKRLNPAWEKTLGWTRDELMSKPIKAFLHPDDIQKTEEVLQSLIGGNVIHTFENRYRCKDGSFRWLLWSSSPDIARKIIYASAIDITSRKKSEDELLLSKRNLEVAAYELEEQNRQLDEFAHIISHNLRAPVNNIKALLNFIDDSSRITDYQLIFEKIRNVTFNISETMNELLETIRIKKTHEIERVEIRFKDILDKVIQSLEGELIESGATVTYNFNNAPKIYYSKPYLESILQNLISNAIKYRSPQRIPEIFVSTDLVKNGIEMRVQDNGLGIDLQQFGHKLFGLHKTFHENKEARGVGLFLTKTQIETLGGNIVAESEVDRGTTFIIQF